MPSKNKRAASRQAKLSQRRRRRGGGRRQKTIEQPTANLAAPGRRRANPAAATATAQAQTPAVAAPAAPTAQRRSRSVAAAPSARTRAAQNRAATYEPLAMYAYLGSELKRIAAVTALMAVALAALTVVFGQA